MIDRIDMTLKTTVLRTENIDNELYHELCSNAGLEECQTLDY